MIEERIFGDWWTMKGGLETLPQERAVKKIIDLLRDPDIGLNPLASALQKCLFAHNIPPPQLAHLFTAAQKEKQRDFFKDHKDEALTTI